MSDGPYTNEMQGSFDSMANSQRMAARFQQAQTQRAIEAQTAEIAQQTRAINFNNQLKQQELDFLRQRQEAQVAEKQRIEDLPKCPACLSPLEASPRKCRNCGVDLNIAMVEKSVEYTTSQSVLSLFEHVPNLSEDFIVKVFYDKPDSLKEQLSILAKEARATAKWASELYVTEKEKLPGLKIAQNKVTNNLSELGDKIGKNKIQFWSNAYFKLHSKAGSRLGLLIASYCVGLLFAIIAIVFFAIANSGGVTFENILLVVCALCSTVVAFLAVVAVIYFHPQVSRVKHPSFKRIKRYIALYDEQTALQTTAKKVEDNKAFYRAKNEVAVAKLAACKQLATNYLKR